MKTKILCLLVAIIAVMAFAVSCFGGPATDDNKKPGGDDGSGISYDYDWTETSILAELSENSASGELTSGCRRYYAGGDTTKYDEIDNAVRDRNRLAAKAANVSLKYDYKGDETQYAWGANVSRIVTQTKAGSTSMPDIYCNFVYDITSAALRGCFANLLDETYPKGNFFRFTEDDYNPVSEDYFDSKAGEGYFYQYMESLSLTPESKIYCLASNYCTDVVRAFLVIPVNINILEQLTKDAPAGDRDKDGDTDVEDFYQMVWADEWDYSMLAAYANKVYATGKDSFSDNTDLGDEVVGFALGAGSGLSASGVLYTSSVQIIQKKADGTYYYPEKNDDLTALATALNTLFKENATGGICTVRKTTEVTNLVPTAQTELQAIRTRFSEDHVLFGGIIAVGSLEDKVYQDMKSSKGFGIVPVPLYQSHKESGDEYLTLVHNIARIVAISKSTEKFSQCSAFLDYQSRTSEEILNTYYDVNLTASVGGLAGEQNSKMLTYIRNHVRNCFDKTYEDAISNYMADTDDTAMSTRWHGILMSNDYQVTNISTLYDELYKNKTKYLNDVYNTWNGIGKDSAN